MKGHGMTIITSISKQVVSLLGFAFVDDIYLGSGAKDVHTTGATMIERFQELIICCNGSIYKKKPAW